MCVTSAIMHNSFFRSSTFVMATVAFAIFLQYGTVCGSLDNFTCEEIHRSNLVRLNGCKIERNAQVSNYVKCVNYAKSESSHVFQNITQMIRFEEVFDFMKEYESDNDTYQWCVSVRKVLFSKYRGMVDKNTTFILHPAAADILSFVIDGKLDARFPGHHAVGILNLDPRCKGKPRISNDCFVSLYGSVTVFAPNKEFHWDIHVLDEVKHLYFETLQGYVQLLRLETTLSGTLSTLWLPYIEGMNMHQLDLHGNKWLNLPALLPTMSELELLDLSYCGLRIIAPGNFNGLPNVSEVNLSGNKFTGFPDGLGQMQNLKVLKLSRMITSEFTAEQEKLKNLTRLEVLDLSHLPLSKLSGNSLSKLHGLQLLNLSYCHVRYLEENVFKKLSSLKVLDLSGNLLLNIRPQTFHFIQRGVVVHLSRNEIVQGQKLEVSNLKLLDLTGNNLTSLSDIVASGHIEFMDLSFNRIINWTIVHPFMQKSYSIANVNLSHNLINYVSSTMGEGLDQLRSVDLGGNPFDCKSCDLLQFQAWLYHRKTNLLNIGTNTNLSCEFPSAMKGEPITNIPFDEELCLKKSPNYLLSAGIPAAILFFIACVTIISGYVYRFEITYIHHLLKARRRQKKMDNDNGCYVYDAFVAYSGEDQEWVLGDLLKNMENEEDKYQLCLHQRDFRLGSFIMENAVECIDKSRKVILVLSKNFIDSEWCRWEVRMVNHRLFEYRENFVVLIELERLDKASLPLHLRCLMDTITYLEWFSEQEHHPVFWRRLKDALGPSLRERLDSRIEEEEDDDDDDEPLLAS